MVKFTIVSTYNFIGVLSSKGGWHEGEKYLASIKPYCLQSDMQDRQWYASRFSGISLYIENVKEPGSDGWRHI